MSTQILTDTDQQVIESLDFEAGCEWSGCTNEADAFATETNVTCACEKQMLICQSHLDRAMRMLDLFARWECAYCGQVVGLGRGVNFFRYEIGPVR